MFNLETKSKSLIFKFPAFTIFPFDIVPGEAIPIKSTSSINKLFSCKSSVSILPEISYSIVGIVLVFFVVVILVPCIQVYMGGFFHLVYLYM